MEILHGGADRPAEKNPFLFANQKDFSGEFEFEEIPRDMSGEIIRTLRNTNHNNRFRIEELIQCSPS
jgi:hypothetical protein